MNQDLVSYLLQEVKNEIGAYDTLPQHEQPKYADTDKMLRQKYGIIPPQLTDTEKLNLALVG